MTSGTGVTPAAYGPAVRAALVGLLVLVAACASPDAGKGDRDDRVVPTVPGSVPSFTMPPPGGDDPTGSVDRAERATVTDVVDGDRRGGR